MPIHIDVHVNNKYIKSYHIGRYEGKPEDDSVNTYLVVEDIGIGKPVWSEGHVFLHRYGDGIDVCIQKGLEALNDVK